MNIYKCTLYLDSIHLFILIDSYFIQWVIVHYYHYLF